MADSTLRVFHGTLVHATKVTPLQILRDKLIGIQHGKIVFVENGTEIDEIVCKFGLKASNDVITLNDREFLMPGFVDTHIHAPQYVNVGKGLDLALLQWLNKYTFPVEAALGDPCKAEAVYNDVVSRVLRNGTTTACYFATIHLQSTIKLCEAVVKHGQRAYVGKVCMDCNSPEFYVQTSEQCVTESEMLMHTITNMKHGGLLTAVLTPRFAVTCSFDMMCQLGQLANKYDAPIQSHLSENKAEIDLVKTLFPTAGSYTEVYDQVGLLTKKTVMAHCIHLSDEEINLLKRKETAVSHCPNSNLSIRSGLCDVRKLLNAGVKVGLGTDVSGGFSPSMLDAIRMTTIVSNILSMQSQTEYIQLDYKEAFRLATLGGSEALGLAAKIGNFEVGKEFDAVRVNMSAIDSPIDIYPSDSLDDMVQKFLYLGDDRNITEVYVAGKRVYVRSNVCHKLDR